MKKNLLYALIAVAMVTGCAKNDVVDSEINKEGNLIGFSTYKNLSRGNPVDDNAEFLAKDNAFGVTAFISTADAPYMGSAEEGIEIVSDGAKWVYKNSADQAFWPVNGETLDFYAYSPYGNAAIATKAFDKADGLALTYTVPAEEAGQVDLMYAFVTEQTKPTGSNSVTLPFKHALTQVHFKIGTSATNLKVDVEANGIRIHNLKNAGTFSTATELWTLEGEATAAYTVTSAAIEGAGYGSYTAIGTADNALMLLPQEFAAGTGDAQDAGAYLTISCKIYQELEDGTKVYLIGNDSEYGNIIAGISSQISIESVPTEVWLRNKKITYNLLIGAGEGTLNPIEFDTTVEEWEDAEGTSSIGI